MKSFFLPDGEYMQLQAAAARSQVLCHIQEHGLEILLNVDSDSSLDWGLRLFISNWIPGCADAAGPRTTSQVTLL